MAAQSKQAPPKQLTPLGYALAGALGGCFSNAVVYPLDTLKTRIQADAGRGRSVRSLLARILKEEGISGFYRGFGATMLNTFSMQYAYFFFYSLVRTSYIKRLAARRPAGSPARSLSTIAELALGCHRRRPRADIYDPRGRHRHPPASSERPRARARPARRSTTGSFLGVAREIPGLVLTVNPAITYGVFERIKGAVLLAREKVGDTGSSLGPGLSFALGATSKSLATVVTYPYIMAKVRIQTRQKGAEEETENGTLPTHNNGSARPPRDEGAVDILARVLRTEGFSGWYKGMGAQILKAVLSQGVLFMSKEQFEGYALAIMALFYRLGARH
ncbi:adenine nucleotide transporter [Lactarius deliciosus]|nr:adenine nucleotide transporter [Lactarius deliciosus]